jgi:mevalonate kinase
MTSASGVARGHAWGKVILLGEHAVVYGAPAIAAGIERGASAGAIRGTSEPSTLVLGDRRASADRESADDLSRAFAALLDVAPVSTPVHVDAVSELPAGGGLGSSAALGVAIARALEALESGASRADVTKELDRVHARASAWECVFHGNPSGIDTAAATHGGCFQFTRAAGVRPLHLAADLWLCVGSTGTSASTRTMVDGIARLRARKPELVDTAIAGITSLVQNGALAIEAGDLRALGKLLDLNQMILAGLMVSTEAIEAMCAIARASGALGAKLTGAGGGGSVLALIDPSTTTVPEPSAAPPKTADAVLAAWRDGGYSGFVTHVRAVPSLGVS